MENTEQKQKCVVKYQLATYSGEEIVYCDANDENEGIISKCKNQLIQRSGGIPLPYGYKSFEIIERENYYGE